MWAMDITYIPLAKGFVYLVAVVDWATRRVLAWRLSITMDVPFCLEAIEEGIAQYGMPDIVNTDQGSQFTSHAFTERLKARGIRLSMDGRGAWRDNIFVERLWRTVKYEEVYLHAYESVSVARAGLTRYFRFYNSRRPHSSLGRQTPDQKYFDPPAAYQGSLTQPGAIHLSTPIQLFKKSGPPLYKQALAESSLPYKTRFDPQNDPQNNRMPVILSTDECESWLDTDLSLSGELQPLPNPYPADEMEAIPVSPMVNNPRNNAPECIQPIG